MPSPPALSISPVMAQIQGAFLLFSFFRAALTSSGQQASLGGAVFAASRREVTTGVVLCSKSRLKCSFHRERQLASVVMRLPSFTRAVFMCGPLQAWRSRLNTLMLLLLAVDSSCWASSCQNLSLSSAMATLSRRFCLRYSVRSPQSRASRRWFMMFSVLSDIQGFHGEDREHLRTL